MFYVNRCPRKDQATMHTRTNQTTPSTHCTPQVCFLGTLTRRIYARCGTYRKSEAFETRHPILRMRIALQELNSNNHQGSNLLVRSIKKVYLLSLCFVKDVGRCDRILPR